MSIFTAYQTDPQLERDGAFLQYKECRIRLARLGGANKQALRLFQAQMKPFRRAIDTETMPEERGQELIVDFLAKQLVKDVHSEQADGEYAQGILDLDGPGTGLAPVNPANVAKMFKAAPELLNEVWSDCIKADWYRQTMREADAKN